MALVHRLFRHLVFPIWLIKRGATLGVRAIVIDNKDQVLLVRHTYMPGWYLPGGGVEVGETMQQALEKELREEVGVHLDGAVEFIGIYLNIKLSKRDHVGLYLCRHWHQLEKPGRNLEIAESGFFALEDLPGDTTPGTRARLAEVLQDGEASAYWC